MSFIDQLDKALGIEEKKEGKDSQICIRQGNEQWSAELFDPKIEA